jgi:hypothetical protein
MSQKVGGESSLPVTSRVDIRVLAELDIYWARNGYTIKSMSQLVSWSCELAVGLLRVSGKSSEIRSIAEANDRMIQRGLYQAVTIKRGIKKLATAMAFDSLREEGIDPREYVPEQYNTMHKSNSIEELPKGIVEEAMRNREYISPYEEDHRKSEEDRRKMIERDKAYIL